MESWLIREDPDVGKDWTQKEKRAAEDEMAGWHHQLNDMSLSKLLETVKDREAWCAIMGSQRVGHNLATEQQQLHESPL